MANHGASSILPEEHRALHHALKIAPDDFEANLYLGASLRHDGKPA